MPNDEIVGLIGQLDPQVLMIYGTIPQACPMVRQLIDLLGKEASTLPPDEKRAKQSEMARLAAERLGDTRLAIEIHNVILQDMPDFAETLASLASLYDREKRWLALAEILDRQVAALRAGKRSKEATALLEKLGQIYSDRLAAPQQAAAACRTMRSSGGSDSLIRRF